MHLQIPQTQVGEKVTLGILGTEPISGGTRVHFILRISYTGNFMDEYFVEQCEKIVGAKATVLSPTSGSLDRAATLFFSLAVNGDLHNPRKYLKAIARKVNFLVKEETLSQLAVNEGDTEEWCALMRAKKSLLNRM